MAGSVARGIRDPWIFREAPSRRGLQALARSLCGTGLIRGPTYEKEFVEFHRFFLSRLGADWEADSSVFFCRLLQVCDSTRVTKSLFCQLFDAADVACT